jgi:hypothetical protein
MEGGDDFENRFNINDDLLSAHRKITLNVYSAYALPEPDMYLDLRSRNLSPHTLVT